MVKVGMFCGAVVVGGIWWAGHEGLVGVVRLIQRGLVNDFGSLDY